MSDRFGTISINPEPASPPQPAKRPKRPKPGLRPRAEKPDPDQKKRRRWIILLAIPVFLITAYGAGGFFLGPSLLTGHLSDFLEQSSNIRLTAGEARLNPFTLQLQLHDVSTTASPQSSAPEDTLLKIDSLLIDLNLLALLRNGLACNRMDIQGLTLSLIRHPDKSYNLPSPAPEGNSGSEEEHLSLSRLPLLFSLNNITVSDSTILFDDRLTGKKHRVEQIKLDLPSLSNFSFTAKEYIRPHFSAVINGSPLEMSGEAALPGTKGENGLKTNLACKVQNLDLPLYFAYLPKSLPLILGKGKGNGKIQVSFLPEDKHGGRLSVDFQLTATEIELGNTEQSLSMTVPTMDVEGTLQPFNGTLRLRNLRLRQPQFSADSGRFSRDMAQLFSPPAAAKKPPEQETFQLDIDALTVEDGTLQLRSQKQQRPAPPPWRSIQLQAKGFSTAPDQAGDKGTFALTGKQDTTNASLTWQGTFNSRGVPGGALELNSVEAGSLFSFFDPAQSTAMSGTAALRGHFTFDPTARNSSMATLSDAAATIHGLTFLDRKKKWLAAGTAEIKGIKFDAGELDLGIIRLQEGVLSLDQEQLPPFLQKFSDPEKPMRMQGLHFSGKASLHPRNDQVKALQLDELEIKANNLTTKPEIPNNFEIAARVNQTGMVKAQGLATLFPLRASLSLVFAAINAEEVAPWLPDAPLFQQGRGTANGKGTYRYPEASFSGTMQLSSALFRNSEKGSGLSVNKAEFNEVTIKAKPLRIGMKELLLDGPQLTWNQGTDSPAPMEQIASFLRKLVFQAQNTTGQQQDDGSSSLPGIEKISIENGTIKHVDQRLTPPWSTEISQLKGSINNLPGKAPGASLDLAGQINAVPFTLSGSADFLTSPVNFTTRLELKGFPLLPLSSQITPLLDLKPESGSFDLSLNHSFQNGEEHQEAAFLFSALRPGSAQSNTALPLALLADSRDQVRLLIPMAKNSTQPLFNQTVAAFQTLMVKAEVAPMLLAGPEFADLQERLYLEFPAGRSELDDKGTGAGDDGSTPRRISALLAAHPRLGLTLTGMADPILDRDAILKSLEEKEKKRVALKNEQRLAEWQARQQKKQQMAARLAPAVAQGTIIEQDLPTQDAPPPPLSPEPVTVDDTTLRDLAQERALQAYDLYTADPGIASARISLHEERSISPPGTPGNRVLIGLRYIEQAGL